MRFGVTVTVVALFCLVYSGGHAISIESVGGKGAIVFPEGDADTNIGLGLIVDMGTVLSNINALKAEASAEYWGDSYDVGYWEWSWRTISFNGTAKYHFPIGSNISPFAGGGLGIVFSRWSTKWAKPIEYSLPGLEKGSSDNDLDLGINLVGGVDIPLGPNLKIVGEAKFSTGGSDTFQISGAAVFKIK